MPDVTPSENVTFPDDFDQADMEYGSTLVPPNTFVTSMVTVISWMDADGESQWRAYSASGGVQLSSLVGLLDMARFSMMIENINPDVLRGILDRDD